MDNSSISFTALEQKARAAGQGHIFRYWDQLNQTQRENLLQQVASIDFAQLAALHETFVDNPQSFQPVGKLEPIQPIPLPASPQQAAERAEMRAAGEAALRRGVAGCLLVAGGQGSRLGFEGPKGIYPITPVRHKSIFQLHAEKILALGRRHGVRIPLYIMTSPANAAVTEQFFAEHRFFGLDAEDIFFFQQRMMPALDENGKLLLDAPDHIFTNPDGHGGVLRALFESGAFRHMQARGLEQVYYFQVDNVLADICDPVFLGYHLAAEAEMSSKVCRKRDAFEKVGVIGKIDGKLGVIEYSDLSDTDKTATDENGQLLHNAGSIAIHFIAVDFLARFEEGSLKLPWHVAYKKIPFLGPEGNLISPDTPNGYKFEKFIFDALAFVDRSAVVEVDRAREFSPVKNAEGDDSPAKARRDLSRFYAAWLEAAGFQVARGDDGSHPAIEISPLFALDQDMFVRKFKGSGRIERAFYLE